MSCGSIGSPDEPERFCVVLDSSCVEGVIGWLSDVLEVSAGESLLKYLFECVFQATGI